jgi:DHA2 family multidrug resistance protein
VTSQERHPNINPWIVATSVMFGTFMEVLDTTVVNVSLPHIAGSLSATVDEATWTLTSYLVANAIILPITGWLASQLGRKRLLMLSVTGFTTASFLCGLAPNLTALIIFRIIQGAAGGCLQPLSQAIMLEAFRPDDRGKAMAFWGVGIVVAPILGPVLGGWLTDTYSWRWVFYINIPVGMISLVMTELFIFDPPYLRRRPGGIDYWGIGMLAVGIGALQIVLDKGEQKDWFESDWIFSLAIVSAVCLVGLVIRELLTKNPVIDLQIFRRRTYAAGVFLMTILGFVLYGSTVLLPIWLQTLQGYPALQAGIAMAPRGVGSLFMMPLVGIIIVKIDPRKLLAVGVTVASVTLFQFSRLNLQAGFWDFFWPLIIQGCGLALLFVPLTTVTMSPIAKEEMGNASSIFNLMRNIGGSFGIAITTTLLARREQYYFGELGRHVSVYNPVAENMLEQLRHVFGSVPLLSDLQGLALLQGLVRREAGIMSFVDVFRILAILFIIVLPLLLLMKRPPKGAEAESAMH